VYQFHIEKAKIVLGKRCEVSVWLSVSFLWPSIADLKHTGTVVSYALHPFFYHCITGKERFYA